MAAWTDLDLNDLVVFAHVVQAGSFTAAGQLLGVPKSTVSRRVSRLEDRLGAQLLERTTRRLGLTEAGSACYQHCVRVLEEVAGAEEAIREMGSVPRGTLRLSASADLGSAFLDRVVTEYLHSHPEVSVQLLPVRGGDPAGAGADVAVSTAPASRPGWASRRLCVVERWLCASPAYLHERGTPRRPVELDGHDCIVGSSSSAVWQLRRAGAEKRVSVSGRLSSDDLGLARAAALEGVGIAALPEYLCADELRAGRLCGVLPQWRLPELVLYAVHPEGRERLPKVRAFLDLLIERSSPPPWSLEEAATA